MRHSLSVSTMKQTSISIGIAVLLIGSSLFLTGSAGGDANGGTGGSKDNVTMNGSTQIIAVSAGNGYSPRLTLAKADVPTILRMKTAGAFSCASALTIPKLGVRKNLPLSGTTDIEIPPQKAGSILQ